LEQVCESFFSSFDQQNEGISEKSRIQVWMPHLLMNDATMAVLGKPGDHLPTVRPGFKAASHMRRPASGKDICDQKFSTRRATDDAWLQS
jgi:hypothetical protein